MKRVGFLLEPIADYENLLNAFYKARRGKLHKPDVRAYGKNLNRNLKTLQSQILGGDVTVGNYHFFRICDPKERLICAAPFAQRVLHHALINICQPYFERKQIDASYACREHKGTHKALARAVVWTKQNRWFLKLDVKKHFDNMCH